MSTPKHFLIQPDSTVLTSFTHTFHGIRLWEVSLVTSFFHVCRIWLQCSEATLSRCPSKVQFWNQIVFLLLVNSTRLFHDELQMPSSKRLKARIAFTNSTRGLVFNDLDESFSRRQVGNRCRANVAHIRQSRPDSGLGFQSKLLSPFYCFHVKALQFFRGFPSFSEAVVKSEAVLGTSPIQIHSSCECMGLVPRQVLPGVALNGAHPLPRKALRGGMSKSFFKRCCQLLVINTHKLAPRTSQGLQERAWDAPMKGLEWFPSFLDANTISVVP